MIKKLGHLIPDTLVAKAVDHGTHITIGEDIILTDDEEIAIAYVDSAQSDLLVILQHDPDNFTFYAPGYGVDEGGSDLVSYWFTEWCNP